MKVIVSGAVPERLAEYCDRRNMVIDHLDFLPTADELRQRIADADYYLLGGDERLSRPVLDEAGKLRCISFMGTGAAAFVDLEAAQEKSVSVLTTPGANNVAVAEFAVGMALGVMRRMLPDVCDRGQPSRSSTELNNSTVGIIGLGATGTALARILVNGFSCQVLHHSRTPKTEIEEKLGLTAVPLDELFARSTVVFVCCSLNETTTGMIDEELLRTGPSPRFLVSIADPRVIVPSALRVALEERLVEGVALDGYYEEPVPSAEDDPHGLLRWQGTSLFVTSHIAASSSNAWARMERVAVDNLISAMEGSSS